MYCVFFIYVSDLLSRLERLKGIEKTVGEVGPTLMNWVSVSTETIEREEENLHSLYVLYLFHYVACF